MKSLNKQIIAIVSVAMMLGSCTPDTKELRVLKEEKITLPKTDNAAKPPLDLSYTIVGLSETEKSVQVFRDPETKRLRDEDNHTFTFAPRFSKRKLREGEEVIIKIAPAESTTERTLPAESFIINRDQISSTETNGIFSLELKKDAFADVEINQEYVILLQAQILAKTPEDLSVKTKNDEPLFHKIKIVFIGDSFPKDNNVEVAERSFGGSAISSRTFSFDSNYAQKHLGKLTDGRTYENWWVSSENPENYLQANFREVTQVQGIKIILKDRNKSLGGVKIYASPDGVAEFYQGQYTLTGGKHKENVYIRFSKPIDVKTIKFIEFQRFASSTINIYEIEFY